jgi:two-component system, NtrC family, response regulator HydG
VPTEVTEQRGRAPLAERNFCLTITAGADSKGILVVAASHPGRVFVGRSSACDLVLRDRGVSRRHLALEVDGPWLRLYDLESTTGTRVNGVWVKEARLTGGEVIQIGDTHLSVEAGNGEGAPEGLDGAGFGRLRGVSREMRRLYPLCARLAASTVSVLIEGETGTGKEVLAEALHEQGPRASAAFVVFDCTAVPSQLIEAELFGHERGAFTGAMTSRRGLLEEADGGTLFIDEVGDLDLALQPKLLRALERREFRRVGGNRQISVDVRILAATRRDLEHEVQVGRFRDDLFHRIAVARIELPPLRRRRGDVVPLARSFAREMGGDEPLPYELLMRWEDAPWPGNVRELRNAVARWLAVGDVRSGEPPPDPTPRRAIGSSGDVIEEVLASDEALPIGRQRVVAEYERRYIERLLERHGGDVKQAIEVSGLARRQFYRLKARHRDER